jgi:hypothetical protein
MGGKYGAVVGVSPGVVVAGAGIAAQPGNVEPS